MEGFDVIGLLTDLLQRTNPAAVALLVPVAAGVKLGVDLVKRLWPQLQGNVVQSITAGVALLVTLVQAGAAGVFADGVTQSELGGIILVAAITFLGAIGFNEALKNTNKPPAPSEDELNTRIGALRG